MDYTKYNLVEYLYKVLVQDTIYVKEIQGFGIKEIQGFGPRYNLPKIK